MVTPHNYNQPLPPNKYNPLAWIGEEVEIGDNCWIGAGVVITGNVKIGNNVSISCGVKIHDHDSSYYHATEGKEKLEHYHIEIQDHVQIGANAVIIPKDKDIVIGNNSIVGALSFLRYSIPPHVVVVGTPAKFIKHVPVDPVRYCSGCSCVVGNTTEDSVIPWCKKYDQELFAETDTGRLIQLTKCTGIK